MKPNLLSITFLILCIDTLCISAQQDSIKVSYSEEAKDSSNYQFKQKYRYLDINMKEEKSLLKIGIRPFSISAQTSLSVPLEIIFEKKISQSSSILFSNFFLFGRSNFHTRDSTTIDQVTHQNALSYLIGIEYRYYYGMKEKITNRVSGNNFNGNYLYIGNDNIFSFGRFSSKTEKMNSSGAIFNYNEQYSLAYFGLGLRAGWGMQRRLGNIGFVDGGAYIDYEVMQSGSQNLTLGIKLIFGLGFNLKKK
jgi:hypothetical protein